MTYTLNNNIKVFLKSKQGCELKTWLEKHKSELHKHRIFYILRANLEKGDVFKIGISERGESSAYGRLNDYYNHVGESNSDNKYMGVKLQLVVGNLFNPNIENNKAREPHRCTCLGRCLNNAQLRLQILEIFIQSSAARRPFYPP